MMKKISYLLLLLWISLLFWHFNSLIEEKNFEIDTLTRLIDSQQKKIEIKEKELKRQRLEIELFIKEIERLRIIRAKVTAYSPLDNRSGICADSTPTVTSRGLMPRRGIMAVDPKRIPYGTDIYIPGYGLASAEDTGGALRQYGGIQLDLVMDTHEEAIQWGVRYIEVKIQ